MEHGARGMEIQARKAGKAGKAGKGKSAGSLFRTTEPQSHRATEVGNQRADDSPSSGSGPSGRWVVN